MDDEEFLYDESEMLRNFGMDEDPDLGISDDNWACGTLDVDS